MSLESVAPHASALDELREPLAELGRRWAASPHRPRPAEDVLQRWDALIEAWVASDLPLILRDQARRGQIVPHSTGRKLLFGDNSPANWAFALALQGESPDLAALRARPLDEIVPLSFLSRGEAAKRNLNRVGWKVCHIEPVSDRRRVRFEASELRRVEDAFRRFLSPRNIFLIPKEISGAGELPEVVSAIAAFNAQAAGSWPNGGARYSERSRN